ncbi:MAG: hypothetical protein WCL51_14665 [Bacteroidota bacterium]
MNKWQISAESKEILTLEYLRDEVKKRMDKEGFSLELFEEYNNYNFKIQFKEKQLKDCKLKRI